MSASPHYLPGVVLHQSQRSRICRAVCSETQQPVILKIVDPHHHDADAALQLKHEFQILERLRPRTGEQPLLVKFEGTEALVRPDKGGSPCPPCCAQARSRFPWRCRLPRRSRLRSM